MAIDGLEEKVAEVRLARLHQSLESGGGDADRKRQNQAGNATDYTKTARKHNTSTHTGCSYF